MTWKADVLGETYSEDELTLGHYIKLEDELNQRWTVIDPIYSAHAARAIFSHLYAERHNVALEHARGVIDTVPVMALIDSIRDHKAAEIAEASNAAANGEVAVPDPQVAG